MFCQQKLLLTPALVAALLTACSGSSEPSSAALESGAGLCAPDQSGYAQRPTWSEIGETPDYEHISSNFNFTKSLRLIASTFDKAVTKANTLRSELEKIEAAGTCDCEGTTDACSADGQSCATLLRPTAGKNDCAAACQELAANGTCGATGATAGWQLSDLYLAPRNVAKKALHHLGFLDGVVKFITGPEFGSALSTISTVTGGLKNTADFTDDVFRKVDQFTEGFHLGGYSKLRPDLWACVPRAGSGVFAQMGNLGGGRFSLGAGYTSGLAAKKVNGLFSMGGATLVANGKSYPILPSVAYNLQMDGFKVFDQDHLFGIDGITISSGGMDVAVAKDKDIFNLVDSSTLNDIAGSDGRLTWNELLTKGFYPIDYTSRSDQQAYVWPRPEDSTDAERKSIAVFGAGLDLKVEMKPLHFDLPAIPIAGVASVQPYFEMESGMAWHNQHNRMLNRISQALGVPAPLLNRDEHALQAPDASRDVGVTAHIDPKIGAELTAGIKLGKYLRAGVFANVGLKVSVAPGVFADTIDTSTPLATFLNTVNPPVDAACTPILQKATTRLVCRNQFASKGQLDAVAALSCDDASNTCITGGLCERYDSLAGGNHAGGQFVGGDAETNCVRSGGIWHPNACGLVAGGTDANGHSNGSTIVGWQGPGCNPLSATANGYIGVDPSTSAALQADIAAKGAPHHSIFTYALSDLTFSAILDASILAQLELKMKLFGKSIQKTWTLFKWNDAWSLGSTNKTWLQKGVEAQYEDDCAAPGIIANHQPARIKRYRNRSSADWASFDDSEELINNWCYPSIADDTSDNQYQVPTNQGLVDSINNYQAMGHDVGEQTWQQNQVCVNGQLSWQWAAQHVPTEQCVVRAATGATALACTQPGMDCSGNQSVNSCETHGDCFCEGPLGSCGTYFYDGYKHIGATQTECVRQGPYTTFVPYECRPVDVPGPGRELARGSCANVVELSAAAAGCMTARDASAPADAPLTEEGYVDVGTITDDEGNLLPAYNTAAWQAWASALQGCLDKGKFDFDIELACVADGTCAPTLCCGDGVQEAHEACDGSASGSGNCTAQCTLPVCGDGRVEGTEQCDNGGYSATCDANCRRIDVAHDNPTIEESIDDGSAPAPTANAAAKHPEVAGLTCDGDEATADEKILAANIAVAAACNRDPDSQVCTEIVEHHARILLDEGEHQAQAETDNHPGFTADMTDSQLWSFCDKIPPKSLLTVSLGLSASFLWWQGGGGIDFVYRLDNMQSAIFFYKGGGVGSAAGFSVGANISFGGARDTETRSVLSAWSGPFGQVSGSWASNFKFAGWGVGGAINYFRTPDVTIEGWSGTVTVSRDFDFGIMGRILGGEGAARSVSGNLSYWYPWDFMTRAFAVMPGARWWPMTEGGNVYLKYADKWEMAKHMVHTGIAIPAVVALGAYGWCH
mgnify:CR=1 FL=1